MLERAESNGVDLRGQTKTHKTIEGGILQTGGTKRKIVTSTLVEVGSKVLKFSLLFVHIFAL